MRQDSTILHRKQTAKIKKLEELLTIAGRKIEKIEIIIAPRNRRPSLDELRQWRDLGVSELVTGPWGRKKRVRTYRAARGHSPPLG